MDKLRTHSSTSNDVFGRLPGAAAVVFSNGMPGATRTLKSLCLLAMTTLSGCWYFVPMHPGSWVSGVVQDANGVPLANATVSLYGRFAKTGADGCFTFQLANALPFTMTGSAPGYQTYTGGVKYGWYRVVMTLQPERSGAASQISWVKQDEEAFEAAARRCPSVPVPDIK